MSLLGGIVAFARAFTSPAGANRNGRSCAVTLITPIRPGGTTALRDVLRGFEEGSPFAKLPDVHFARWVVIDQLRTDWPKAPKHLTKLRSSYLLFTADVTARPRELDRLPHSFFEDLVDHIPEQAAAVWSNCYGCPSVSCRDDFVRYLDASQVDASLYYAAYPDATVADIRRALRVRDELATFVFEHQRADPDELKRDYLEASKSWRTSN